MKALAHPARAAARRDRGAIWAALFVVVILGLAVWGAWTLGVMAGDQAEWRQRFPDVPSALRRAPSPQPTPLPLPRRPAVSVERAPAS